MSSATPPSAWRSSSLRVAIGGRLDQHATDACAHFAVEAWLGDGDLEAVRRPMERWLEVHATHPAAKYVYRAWLDRERELDAIQRPIGRWLKQRRACCGDGGRTPAQLAAMVAPDAQILRLALAAPRMPVVHA